MIHNSFTIMILNSFESTRFLVSNSPATGPRTLRWFRINLFMKQSLSIVLLDHLLQQMHSAGIPWRRSRVLRRQPPEPSLIAKAPPETVGYAAEQANSSFRDLVLKFTSHFYVYNFRTVRHKLWLCWLVFLAVSNSSVGISLQKRGNPSNVDSIGSHSSIAVDRFTTNN